MKRIPRVRIRSGPIPRPLEDRFWAKVTKGPGCWIWTASSRNIYGRIRLGGRLTGHEGAHRVAWKLANGPIPDGMDVLHHCDTPLCVRTEPDDQWPDGHLFVGTAADNNADRDAKGRTSRGAAWYAARSITPHPRRSRAKPDPVTASVRWAVIQRDGSCVLALLISGHVCRDRWGEQHPATALSRLTIEHVKTDLGMGVRAESNLRHLVALCGHANIAVPSKDERAAMRAYLERLEGPDVDRSRPWERIRRVRAAVDQEEA